MRNYRTFFSVAAALVLAAAFASADSIVFYDDFESYGTTSVLNWTPPATSPWTVADGTVDYIVDPNSWGLDASTGSGIMDGGTRFLDLDGSTRNAGILMSIDLSDLSGVSGSVTPGPFTSLVSGQLYKLEFIMAGNQRSGSDNVQIGVGVSNNNAATTDDLISVSLSNNAPWTRYTATFIYQGGDMLYFENLGGDNIGVLLDNVRISAVPEPATMGLLGMGLGGLVLARIRRKRS